MTPVGAKGLGEQPRRVGIGFANMSGGMRCDLPVLAPPDQLRLPVFDVIIPTRIDQSRRVPVLRHFARVILVSAAIAACAPSENSPEVQPEPHPPAVAAVVKTAVDSAKSIQ